MARLVGLLEEYRRALADAQDERDRNIDDMDLGAAERWEVRREMYDEIAIDLGELVGV